MSADVRARYAEALGVVCLHRLQKATLSGTRTVRARPLREVQCALMADRITYGEIEQLKHEWAMRLEDVLSDTALTSDELRELAGHNRTLANLSDSRGQRRGFSDIAERLERAAADRATLSG